MNRFYGNRGTRGQSVGGMRSCFFRVGKTGQNSRNSILFWVVVFVLIYCVSASAGTGGKVYVGADVELEPSESRTESSVTFSKTTGPARSMRVEGDAPREPQNSGKIPVVVEMPLDGRPGLAVPRK